MVPVGCFGVVAITGLVFVVVSAVVAGIDSVAAASGSSADATGAGTARFRLVAPRRQQMCHQTFIRVLKKENNKI